MDELRKFLSRHNLSQQDLAQEIGVSDAFVSMLLSGKSGTSLATAKAILAFCRKREAGITFEHLFGPVELPAAVNEG
ncbi:MAG: helix-turn-helix transcriptional regulator [Acidobacteriota bacterium]